MPVMSTYAAAAQTVKTQGTNPVNYTFQACGGTAVVNASAHSAALASPRLTRVVRRRSAFPIGSHYV